MCDTPVQLLPLAPQQRAIGRVLDQRVLEEEAGLWRRTPAERETGGDELIQRGIQLSRVPLRDGHQQLIGELPAKDRADLRDLPGGRAQPIQITAPGSASDSSRAVMLTPSP
jgi:hypothetical protein